MKSVLQESKSSPALNSIYKTVQGEGRGLMEPDRSRTALGGQTNRDSLRGRQKGVGPAYLVVILAGHDIGERDLSLEHLPAVHELYQQVAHGLELHPLGRFYI